VFCLQNLFKKKLTLFIIQATISPISSNQFDPQPPQPLKFTFPSVKKSSTEKERIKNKTKTFPFVSHFSGAEHENENR